MAALDKLPELTPVAAPAQAPFPPAVVNAVESVAKVWKEGAGRANWRSLVFGTDDKAKESAELFMAEARRYCTTEETRKALRMKYDAATGTVSLMVGPARRRVG